MPFTQAVLEMAVTVAGGRKIRRLRLRVGWLSSVVPESVEMFFGILSRGGPAEGAALAFETVPLKLSCRNCGRETTVPYEPDKNPRLALGEAFRRGCDCGRGDFKILDGLGFELAGVEVEDDRPSS